MSAPSSASAETLAKRLDKLYEFEREPVSPDKLQGGRRFAALFAGEHVAATEFVIGALFVQWGASASDLVWGLILGNLLAVLSWAFICAPIAVRVRVTLYWYARRIIGPGLTVIYNIVNAMLYCCLAAAMIGVSASAIIQVFNKIESVPHIQHPTLRDVLPNSVGWVLVVCLVGTVTIVLAIAGFKKLSQFSSICSPWMFTIFIVGAVASLASPRLSVNSVGDFWQVAESRVWSGQPYEKPVKQVTPALPAQPGSMPVPNNFRQELAKETGTKGLFGQSTAVVLSDDATISMERAGQRWRIEDGGRSYVIKMVTQQDEQGNEIEKLMVCAVQGRLFFWQLVFFAWFCNLAMHVGLSDMALFRYARRWQYGFFSAFGMYLGHFLAWICAGIMGAAVSRELNPGEMADNAAGVAGMLAVLLAGWTTANPTIYRAGLALQIVTPNWPRWMVTLAAGAITTVIGFFPAIFMKLLDFVAIYGLTLMPIGAVIVVEHWVFPRLGLHQFWADRRKLSFNPAALIAWVAVLVLCFPIEQFTDGAVQSPMAMLGVHLFFRWLPGWFIAAILYIVLSMVMGARPAPGESLEKEPDRSYTGTPVTADAVVSQLGPKAWIAGAVAVLALVYSVYIAMTVFLGGSDPAAYEANMGRYKPMLLVATLIYFVAAIIWAGEREKVKPVGEQA